MNSIMNNFSTLPFTFPYIILSPEREKENAVNGLAGLP